MKKSVLAIIICVLVCVFLMFSACNSHQETPLDDKNDFDALYPMPSKCVYAEGKTLYDHTDAPISLRGVNIGNWLVPEGWMGVIDIDGQNDNQDGEKLTYKKMITALKNNENNFSDEQISSLLEVYYANWFTELDVKFIKESGFNCIRLPFGYFNVADENGDILPDGFKWIDKCLEWCQKYGVYCLLDLHGAYGSQNKEHHSGDDTQCILFEDSVSQEKTAKLWRAIAQRYKDNTVVLGYDLLNEPTGNTGKTVEAQHRVHDMLYKTIREVDSEHLIFIESCWEFSDFPLISEMNWENVVFEMHMYDFSDNSNQYLLYHMFIYTFQEQLKQIPMFIGEFWLGVQDLRQTLNTFESNNFGWTSWTYKTNRCGAWGMKNLDIDRVNLSHATYDEIKGIFLQTTSENATISAEYTKLLELLSEIDQEK